MKVWCRGVETSLSCCHHFLLPLTMCYFSTLISTIISQFGSKWYTKVLFISQDREDEVMRSLDQAILGNDLLFCPAVITKQEQLLPFLNGEHVPCQTAPLKRYLFRIFWLGAGPREDDAHDLCMQPPRYIQPGRWNRRFILGESWIWTFSFCFVAAWGWIPCFGITDPGGQAGCQWWV